MSTLTGTQKVRRLKQHMVCENGGGDSRHTFSCHRVETSSPDLDAAHEEECGPTSDDCVILCLSCAVFPVEDGWTISSFEAEVGFTMRARFRRARLRRGVYACHAWGCCFWK